MCSQLSLCSPGLFRCAPHALARRLPFLLSGQMNLLVRSHTDRHSQWRAFSYSEYQWLESDSTWNRTSGPWRRGLLSNDEGGSILKRPFVQEILGSWKHIYQSKETFSWSNYGFILVFTVAAWRPVSVDTVALMALWAVKVQLNKIFVIECPLLLMQPFLSYYISCKVHGPRRSVHLTACRATRSPG